MNIAGYNIRPFVITVQEMPEREAFIRRHFKEVGIEAESFGGISGELSGLVTEHKYEIDNPGSGWKIGAKPVACWVTFWAFWSALNLLPDSHFWQLEWDCQFPADWRPRVEAALRDTPADFDMLFIGSCCAQDRVKRHIKGNVYEVHWPQCGHCTIIAKKALPVLLRTQRKVYAPLDISLTFHSLPLLKVYTVLPRIANQFGTIIPP
jgi:hypothetical protein